MMFLSHPSLHSLLLMTSFSPSDAMQKIVTVTDVCAEGDHFKL